ncbi:beta strand repeat-containing protein, partial [Hymenobacter ruricola]|nr:hypothetical protein [Hymenobacter ruricola]
MMHFYPLAARAARTALLGSFLSLLAWLLPGTALAQAPVWAGATSGNNFQPPTGGTSTTRAVATDPATGNVYATGSFAGTVTFGNTRLVSAGSSDVFVAKWDVTAQAWTSAVSGGGTNLDQGLGIAVSSAGGVASVYVTGSYQGTATIAGTPLTAAGLTDAFVAKYTDPGTGLATTNGGAVSGGGSVGTNQGLGIAVGSAGGVASVYVTGSFNTSTTIAGTPLTAVGSTDLFVAKYTDPGTGLTNTNGGAVSGGSSGADQGTGVAVSSAGGVASVYVTGSYNASATIAGTALTAAGGSGQDVFVAKYTDPGTGLSTTNGGAVSGGGTGIDAGQGVAVSSAGGVVSVYVTGYFTTSATIAGTALTAAGGQDVFVAKYTDAGTGLTSTNGGAVSGGGSAGNDQGTGIAVGSAGGVASVYVTGYFTTSATIAGSFLTGAGSLDVFVAKYTDPGTGLATTNGGAVSGGGTGTDQGYGVAVSGSSVYAGAVVGTGVAGFGSSPVRRAPVSSAVLARLDAGTLGYLGIEGPLQGGISSTLAVATDPATGNVYATGYYSGTVAFGNTRLVSAGSDDVFVAKWDVTAQAWTSAVSGGGGTSIDQGKGVAVSSANGVASVYITGYFTTSATIAGTTLTAAGSLDVFVAKYTDPGTGLSTTNGGAVSGGGT